MTETEAVEAVGFLIPRRTLLALPLILSVLFGVLGVYPVQDFFLGYGLDFTYWVLLPVMWIVNPALLALYFSPNLQKRDLNNKNGWPWRQVSYVLANVAFFVFSLGLPLASIISALDHVNFSPLQVNPVFFYTVPLLLLATSGWLLTLVTDA